MLQESGIYTYFQQGQLNTIKAIEGTYKFENISLLSSSGIFILCSFSLLFTIMILLLELTLYKIQNYLYDITFRILKILYIISYT